MDDDKTRRGVEAAVLDAVRELNRMAPPDEKIGESLSTPLLEGSGRMDSLTVVNLIVETETAVEDRLGVRVSLGDAPTSDREGNPYATLGSFVQYVCELVDQRGDR